MTDTDLISVIIPVKNEKNNIQRCLDSLFNQKINNEFEVIVIDSGSTDGTLEILKRYPVRVEKISPEAFGHGRTRQDGVSFARGNLLVFTVADAMPFDVHWLKNLTMLLIEDTSIAASYGIQVPFSDAKYSELDNKILRAGLHLRPKTQKISGQQAFNDLSPEERRILCNFDNCNSCIRKTVLLNIPFDDVCYAEDFLWCKKSILAGHVVAFVPEAVVSHFHPQSFRYAFLRNCYDAMLSMKTFGLYADETFFTLFNRLGRQLNHVGRGQFLFSFQWVLNRLKINLAVFLALQVALLKDTETSHPFLYKLTQPIRKQVIKKMERDPIIHE